MTDDGARRVATAAGAMLIAPRSAGEFEGAGSALFRPAYWRSNGSLAPASRGRGSTWFIAQGSADWALRHYRRGGRLAAYGSLDLYLWTGESHVRSFAEWRFVLQSMRGRCGL